MCPGFAEGAAAADFGGGDGVPEGREREGVDARSEVGGRRVSAVAWGDEEFVFFELSGDGGQVAVVPIDDAFGGVASADEEDAAGAGGGAGFARHVEEEPAVGEGGGEPVMMGGE